MAPCMVKRASRAPFSTSVCHSYHTMVLGRYRHLARSVARTAILGSLAILAGCSRTVNGGFADSPDKMFRLYGRVYGAYGHTFVDETGKTIRYTIVANDSQQTQLLRKEYKVRGSDVCWTALWDGRDSLTIVVYDYGPGVAWHEAQRSAVLSNRLCTIYYRFDAKTGGFSEQPAR
jgi:hypothetical protein